MTAVKPKTSPPKPRQRRDGLDISKKDNIFKNLSDVFGKNEEEKKTDNLKDTIIKTNDTIETINIIDIKIIEEFFETAELKIIRNND